jgi:hypothetical protein
MNRFSHFLKSLFTQHRFSNHSTSKQTCLKLENLGEKCLTSVSPLTLEISHTDAYSSSSVLQESELSKMSKMTTLSKMETGYTTPAPMVTVEPALEQRKH